MRAARFELEAKLLSDRLEDIEGGITASHGEAAGRIGQLEIEETG